MKTLFTIHAGEYLVGTEIEKLFKNYRIWIPSKDTGVDLLVTDKLLKKNVSIQVKFSKDFRLDLNSLYHDRIRSCGWFTLNKSKIQNSPAQVWILVLYDVQKGNMQYIIIEPQELLKRYAKMGRKGKILQSYFWINASGECWETRDLKKKELISVANGIFSNKTRNFTPFLNNWKKLTIKMS